MSLVVNIITDKQKKGEVDAPIYFSGSRKNINIHPLEQNPTMTML